MLQVYVCATQYYTHFCSASYHGYFFLCMHVCATYCMMGHYPVIQKTHEAIIQRSLGDKFLISLESGCPVSLLTYYT